MFCCAYHYALHCWLILLQQIPTRSTGSNINCLASHFNHCWIDQLIMFYALLCPHPSRLHGGGWEVGLIPFGRGIFALNFTTKPLRIARFCHAKGRHAPNFAEKTFTNSHKTAKVFSLESFPLYGNSDSCITTSTSHMSYLQQ